MPLQAMAEVAHALPFWTHGIILDEDACLTICECLNRRLYVCSVMLTTLLQMVGKFSTTVKFSVEYKSMLHRLEYDLNSIRVMFRSLHNVILQSHRNETLPEVPRSSAFKYTGPWDPEFWRTEGNRIFPNKLKLIGKALDVTRQGTTAMALYYKGSDPTCAQTNNNDDEKRDLLDKLNQRISVTREVISLLDFMALEE